MFLRESAVALLLTGATALPAFASTCMRMEPHEVAKRAEVAFVGTVLKVEADPYRPWELCWDASHGDDCGGKRVTFELAEVLRGRLEKRVEVISEDACYCLGSYWEVGSDYLVIAEVDEANANRLVAGSVCAGTGKLDERQSYLGALRK